jgi:hypothetical protein
MSFVAIDTNSIIVVSLSELESSCQDSKKMGMAKNCNPFLANPLNMPIILYRFHAQDKKQFISRLKDGSSTKIEIIKIDIIQNE